MLKDMFSATNILCLERKKEIKKIRLNSKMYLETIKSKHKWSSIISTNKNESEKLIIR